jgi:hypothetical protein
LTAGKRSETDMKTRQAITAGISRAIRFLRRIAPNLNQNCRMVKPLLLSPIYVK